GEEEVDPTTRGETHPECPMPTPAVHGGREGQRQRAQGEGEPDIGPEPCRGSQRRERDAQQDDHDHQPEDREPQAPQGGAPWPAGRGRDGNEPSCFNLNRSSWRRKVLGVFGTWPRCECPTGAVVERLRPWLRRLRRRMKRSWSCRRSTPSPCRWSRSKAQP